MELNLTKPCGLPLIQILKLLPQQGQGKEMNSDFSNQLRKKMQLGIKVPILLMSSREEYTQWIFPKDQIR